MDDPAKRQYWVFSGILALLISFILNFGLFELFKGTILYGLPFSFAGTEGIGTLVIKLLDTAIIALLFTPGIFYFFQWFIRRPR